MVYIIRVQLYTREQEYKSVVIKLLVIKQFEFILKNMLNNFVTCLYYFLLLFTMLFTLYVSTTRTNALRVATYLYLYKTRVPHLDSHQHFYHHFLIPTL